jgi:hypothetical protein
LPVVKDIPSHLLGISLNNPSMSNSFFHLLIHLSHLLYEQHVALVQGIVVGADMVFMPF